MNFLIAPLETTIVGNWKIENGRLVADDAAKKIETLIQSWLVKISESTDGWSVLYLDQTDGRYWELTYPESRLHGGGAPSLTCISIKEATKRFKQARRSEK